jgi:hypothetical protein
VHIAGIELSQGIQAAGTLKLQEKFLITAFGMFTADFEHKPGVDTAKIKKKCLCFYGIVKKAAS